MRLPRKTQKRLLNTFPQPRRPSPPRQRHHRITARDQFQTEQHDHDEPHREHQRAHQRSVGLRNGGEGEAGGNAQQRAGKHAAYQQVFGRQAAL